MVGSRPTGWWRDRPGAAGRFVASVRSSAREGALTAPIVVVLEGEARHGAPPGEADGVEVVHAPGEGDDTIAALAAAGGQVVVVTADRALGERVRRKGGDVAAPRWLLDRLPP